MIALKEWRRRAHYLDVNGDKIAYWTSAQEEGSARDKPLLLLIHGYPTSSWDWAPLWAELEKHFRLAALDMRGFGLSDKPKNINYSIMDQADLQETLLAHLGENAAHLFVHDYGVTVAQELLARHLEGRSRFALMSVCFLNGGLFPEQHRARPIQKLGLSPLGPLMGAALSPARLRKTLDEVFGPHSKASDEEITGHWELITEKRGKQVLHKLLNYIPERRRYRERWVGALKNARLPMRLINGGADPVSGAHLYEYYQQQIPDADAVLLEEIGHYPHMEAPQDVLSAFLAFHGPQKAGADPSG